jgi:hypothetical protein
MTLDLAHRLAAATAVHDPSLMLELRIADAGTEPPPRRRPRGDLGALLIAAAVVVAVVWANLPLGYDALWEAPILGTERRGRVAVSTDTRWR